MKPTSLSRAENQLPRTAYAAAVKVGLWYCILYPQMHVCFRSLILLIVIVAGTRRVLKMA